jgi:hypothetical protein
MEPEGLLLCSQKPATGPYPEPDEMKEHKILYRKKSKFFNVIIKVEGINERI